MISVSAARDRGATVWGGSTGEPIRVLVFRGCRMEMGMSIDRTLTGDAVDTEMSTGLSLLTLLQTRFLVT